MIVTVHRDQQRMNHKDSKTEREPITFDALAGGNWIAEEAFLVCGQGFKDCRKALVN